MADAFPNATNGIGRATFGRDRWFSYDSDGEAAHSLTTAPIVIPSQPCNLTLNVQTTVRGYVKVEVLDAGSGAPLPGLTMSDSVPTMGNYLQRAQRWASGAALPAGKTVRLRFESVQAKLFAFGYK